MPDVMLRLYIWSCILVMAGACRSGDEPRPIYVDLEDAFQLDLFESLDFTTRQFQLLLTTLDPLPCQNYELDYATYHTGTQLQIQLNSLIPPEGECITPPSPLTAAIALGYLIPNVYELDILIQDVLVYSGVLEVRPDRYMLYFPSGQGIKLVHKELYRIPNYAIWGYVAYDELQLEGPANDFLQELESISVSWQVVEGYYGYFSIDTLGQPVFDPPADALYVRPFFRIYDDGSREELIQLLGAYRTQWGSQLDIVLYTHWGERL